ncbi:hypothetical protein KTE17_31745, partial [Burkholderia gladioli]|uniref:hypothetical protein n=1 Tax=Burkholderia gladioli TaxID=28095 RepID=UPI001C232910
MGWLAVKAAGQSVKGRPGAAARDARDGTRPLRAHGAEAPASASSRAEAGLAVPAPRAGARPMS